jgi:hypothetical protein
MERAGVFFHLPSSGGDWRLPGLLIRGLRGLKFLIAYLFTNLFNHNPPSNG